MSATTQKRSRTAASSAVADPDKRTKILDAALELFVERGFHGTAVPLVAQKAGVGAGTIYRYFDSKEALVNTLYQENKGAIGAYVLDGFAFDGAPRKMFARVWQRMCEFVDQHPQVYAFMELHHHASYLDEGSRAAEEQLYQLAVAFVLKAQGDGVLRPAPPPVLLALVHGAFVGLVRFRRDGRVSWDAASLQAAEEACWDLIAAR